MFLYSGWSAILGHSSYLTAVSRGLRDRQGLVRIHSIGEGRLCKLIRLKLSAIGGSGGIH